MSEIDDAGKKILTDDEIEWLEDQGVDTNDPDAVHEALESHNNEIEDLSHVGCEEAYDA